MKFKVGDKVEYIEHSKVDLNEDEKYFTIGKIHTIKYIFENVSEGENSHITLDDIYQVAYPEQIRIARIRNNKLSRKMYPNYRVIDKDWLEYKGD